MNDRSTLRRQLLAYIGIRVVVVATMLVVFYLAAPAAEPSQPSFFTKVFLLGFVATLVYIVLLHLLPSYLGLQAYLQFFGDLALITSLIYYFGGTSPFSPLYLIIISLATTILRQRAGFLVASGAYLMYAGLMLGLHSGLLGSPTGGIEQQTSERLVYSLVVHLFGFFAVARLTAYLASGKLRAEMALEEKDEDLADLQVVHRDVVASIPSGIATTDLDGNITSINRAGLRILGFKEESLVGQNIVDSELFSRQEWERYSSFSEDRSRTRDELTLERNGTRLSIGFSISRLTDSEGAHRGNIVIFQDLSRWRKLEAEVRMKDRMAAVGELAAGIAHEIGNPLAAISGSAQMLAQSGSLEGTSENKLLGILLKESQRLDRTIKGFLRFARPKERSTVRFDIAALLAENAELLRNSPEVSTGHRIGLDLDPPNLHLMGDPDQISQIFWNLARNALKAMPDGGTLTIGGRLIDQRYRMAFADTGKGMNREEQENLFHPFQSFFDTGVGIGMAIVYRIVEEHGGSLQVDSTPGAGSTIVIELPATTTESLEVAQR